LDGGGAKNGFDFRTPNIQSCRLNVNTSRAPEEAPQVGRMGS
jgi:hypothetical protein